MHGINLIRFIVALCAMMMAHGVCGQRIEAETGILSGTQVSTQLSGYSGTGYVTGFDADGDQVALAVNTHAGVYDLFVTYASPFGDKFNHVLVNGDNMGSIAFPLAASFVERKVGKVFLREGSNTLSIVKDWGYFHVDDVRLEPSSRSPIGNVSDGLTTPSPSAEADSLYNFLKSVYGKVILSGQYGDEAEFNHIEDLSGRRPVMRGFDMIDYSPSRTERGATSAATDKAIEWSRRRGVTTFCWHWNAPKDLIDEPGKEWWRGFYTEATTFDVSKAMNDQASEEYALILRDIDAIALQLKRLKDANVPVLWRPLHEAEGKWFWWGAKGPAPCIWLWRLLFDRLVNHHGLNNLIWVWTSTASPDAMSWYPGNEYVDILGADIYLPAGAYGSHFAVFDNIASIFDGKKIIALSENGPIPDPEKLFEEGVAWSWFSTWSGSFITDGVMNSPSHVEKVFNHDYVITLDEIDDIDDIIQVLEERRQTGQPPPVTGVEDEVGLGFQNPLRGEILALSRVHFPARISIYDVQGKKQFPEVESQPDGYVEFDFQQKPAGVYLLRIVTPATVKVLRIVKAHH